MPWTQNGNQKNTKKAEEKKVSAVNPETRTGWTTRRKGTETTRNISDEYIQFLSKANRTYRP